MAWIREKINTDTEKWTDEEEYNNRNDGEFMAILSALICLSPLWIWAIKSDANRYVYVLLVVTNIIAFFMFKSFFERVGRLLIVVGLAVFVNNVILLVFGSFFLTESEQAIHFGSFFMWGNIILAIIEIALFLIKGRNSKP